MASRRATCRSGHRAAASSRSRRRPTQVRGPLKATRRTARRTPRRRSRRHPRPSTPASGIGRRASAQVNLLRVRTSTDTSIGYLYVSTTGTLCLRNDAGAKTLTSSVVPDLGWHLIELTIQYQRRVEHVERQLRRDDGGEPIQDGGLGNGASRAIPDRRSPDRSNLRRRLR